MLPGFENCHQIHWTKCDSVTDVRCCNKQQRCEYFTALRLKWHHVHFRIHMGALIFLAVISTPEVKKGKYSTFHLLSRELFPSLVTVRGSFGI